MAYPILKLGDKGAIVGDWQRLLARDGFSVGKVDDDFGRRTHNAQVAWEHAHGLVRDGVVSEAEWNIMLSGVAPEQPATTVRSTFDLDRVPYVEAANWSRALPSQSKRLIVIHCMEAVEAATTAEGVADWFAGKRGPAPQTSAHYCVDSDSVICCVHSDRVAWHAPGANREGIGVELAGFVRQTQQEWLDAYSASMLRLAAKLVRALNRRHGIPLAYVDEWSLGSPGATGVTTHRDVSRAYHKSTHTDPGPNFPMDQFLEWARGSS